MCSSDLLDRSRPCAQASCREKPLVKDLLRLGDKLHVNIVVVDGPIERAAESRSVVPHLKRLYFPTVPLMEEAYCLFPPFRYAKEKGGTLDRLQRLLHIEVIRCRVLVAFVSGHHFHLTIRELKSRNKKTSGTGAATIPGMLEATEERRTCDSLI